MRCGKCGKDNREERRFCARMRRSTGCEVRAVRRSNEPDEKFCGECGAPQVTGSRATT
jgi:hypothetical protein